MPKNIEKPQRSKRVFTSMISIDEKIEELLEWNRKYPLATIVPFSLEKLKTYTHSEEEYQALAAEYKKMQNYYDYLRHRKWEGALTPEDEELCKEGNIRGVFGYPRSIEALSQKFRIKPEKIDYIISKFGSIESFIKAYIEGSLDREDLSLLRDNLADLQIDINYGLNSPFNILYNAILSRNPHSPYKSLRIFDSNKIIDALSNLTEQESTFISYYYGLYDGKCYSKVEIEKRLGVRRRKTRFS